MNILAIETTGAEASVAIINNNYEVFTETSTQKLNHLQNLMPMVDILLEKCRLTINDISYIAVSEGPGSFTGIRIGVSSARALAQVLNVEVISVPTLKSFAYHVQDYKGIICPIFDARRNQVYGGAYLWAQDGICKEFVTGAAYDLNDLLEELKQNIKNSSRDKKSQFRINDKAEITFYGDGIETYKSQILQWQNLSSNSDLRILFAKDGENLQKASSIAKLAYELFMVGEIKNFNDLKPVYMRKAEAERKLEEKG